MIPSRTILDEAAEIIYGDREKTYGHPAKNLQLISEYWNVFLDRKKGEPLTPEDICGMMILMKIARLQNTKNHRDSQVDIAGYAALMERISVTISKPVELKKEEVPDDKPFRP